MKISSDLIEGLEMIEARYFFGYFSSKGENSMELWEEDEEYRMRDAFFKTVRLLKDTYRAERNLINRESNED